VEIFRVTRDVWGQEVLQGISWDLLPVFFGLGVLFIGGHALYRMLLSRKRD